MLRNLKYMLIFSTVFVCCENHSPFGPEADGLVALQLNFLGRPIRSGKLHKLPVHNFSHLMVEIYSEEITSSTAEISPLATTTIKIDSSATAFEGRLTLPAGEKRFLVVRLFESKQDNIAESSVLSYCGKTRNVSIFPGKSNEVTVDLFPVPIKNRRVVFWLESAQMEPETLVAEVPFLLASLDSIRGIQFDLVFEPAVVRTDSISKNEVTRQFSDILYNETTNQGTRIIMFDQTQNSPWLTPNSDACAAPIALFQLNVRVTNPTLEAVEMSIERAIVSIRNFEEIEVFAIPARIFRQSN